MNNIKNWHTEYWMIVTLLLLLLQSCVRLFLLKKFGSGKVVNALVSALGWTIFKVGYL